MNRNKLHFCLTDLCAIAVVTLFAAAIGGTAVTGTAAKAKELSCKDKLGKIAELTFSYSENYNDHSVANYRIGWVRELAKQDSSVKESLFHCPDDNVKRKWNGKPISYYLSTGHLWNVRNTRTNRQEWGMVCRITGNPIQISQAANPSDTVLFMENWYQGNSYRQIGQPGNRLAFSSRTLYGFHNKGLNCNVAFLDGHVEDIVAKKWAIGSNRGIVFKEMHKRCIPNMK